MIKIILFTLCLTGAFGGVLYADEFVTITAKDDRSISVIIKNKTEDSVTVQNPDGNIFKIPLSRLNEESARRIGSWIHPIIQTREYLNSITVCSVDILGNKIDESTGFDRTYSWDLDAGRDDMWVNDERDKERERVKSEFLVKMRQYSETFENEKNGMVNHRISLLNLIEIFHNEAPESEFGLRLIHGNLNHGTRAKFYPPYGTGQISLIIRKKEIRDTLSSSLDEEGVKQFQFFYDAMIASYLEIDERIKNGESPYYKTTEELKRLARGPYYIINSPN